MLRYVIMKYFDRICVLCMIRVKNIYANILCKIDATEGS